jgi:3'(2'), 5'-bisphosphate nucleotidase
VNRADELEAMLAIAREASAVVARVYETNFAVDYKGPADPVTEADRQANALICRRLAEAFGPLPVVAEESDESAFAHWVGARRAFFVDPLDGTLEFIARNGDFVVMIGLVEDGVPVAGVVVAPTEGTAWAGGPELGSYEIAATGERRRLRVTTTDELAAARAVVSRSHPSDRLMSALDRMSVSAVTPRGSAGLKGAEVATGRADFYLQPGRAGKRWDSCAPEAIVAGAGGRCTDTRGEPIDYRGPELWNNGGFLASNGVLHARILQALR